MTALCARICAIAAAIALGGCADLSFGGPIEAHVFMKAVAQAACEESAACDDPLTAKFTSIERCARRDYFEAKNRIQTWYDSSYWEYSPAAAAACLDWLASRRSRCETAWNAYLWKPSGSPCASVFGRSRGTGQACEFGGQCRDGPCAASAPCGPTVCQPARATGDKCTTHIDCGFAMQCGANRRCRPARTPVEYQPCEPFESCGPEATCVQAGICMPRGALGSTCSTHAGGQFALCAPGLVCGSFPSTCRQALEIGDPCGAHSRVRRGQVCADGQVVPIANDGDVCSKDRANCTGEDRACRPRPDGQRICAPVPEEDEPCLAMESTKAPTRRCAHGLYCDLAAGLCRWSFAKGQACETDSECKAGSVCVSGKCVRGAPLGKPCSSLAPWRCAAGGWCKASVCVPLSGLGGSCDSAASSCIDGLRCGGEVCVPLSLSGGPCTQNGDCAVGLACNGLTCGPPMCKSAP
ncbi:MAG: hypothetical protein FJ100_08475 [Deltaproteobacteria bacterium]|nr:hypothetical protein [Deltaproteobacteria bacterium]